MSENPYELAGTANDGRPSEPEPDEARTIHVMSFDKDDMDFRAVDPDKDFDLFPKGASAEALASEQKSPRNSPTGLEDVL